MDASPMRRVDDMIDSIGEGNFMSTLDLIKGYWQISVQREDWEMAFKTPSQLFQFNRMPFGLQESLITFQRMVDKLLKGLEAYLSAHIDDIIV